MSRFWYGGGIADWTFAYGDDVVVGELTGEAAVVVGDIAVTFWSQEQGGDQYTDLVDADGNRVTEITSSAGTATRAKGQIPPFQGPDNITQMWAQAGDSGSRALVQGALGDAVLAVTAQAAQTQQSLAAHLGSATSNPHGTRYSDLVGVSPSAPQNGQVYVYDAATGNLVPTTVQGLNAADFVSTKGGSEITIPNGNTTTKAMVVRVPAGDRTGAVNAIEVWWNAGTAAAPNWQLVTRFNEYGELRGQPSSPARTWLRGKQYSAAQTANIMEVTDWNNVPLWWIDAIGRSRGPNIGIPIGPFSQDTGALGGGTYRCYNPTGVALTIRSFIVSAGGTIPAGGDYVINPKVDGVAIYSNANRPRIVAGQRSSGLATALSTTTWPAGSYITVDVDEVGTTPPTKVSIQGLAY